MSQHQTAANKSGVGMPRTPKAKSAPSKPMPYMCDVKLLPRVRRYIENKSPNDPADVESIVTYLQKTYPDYKRKKRLTFRHSVSRALDVLVEELGTSSSDEGDVDILSAKRPKSDNYGKDKGITSGGVIDSDASLSPDGVYTEYQDSNGVNSLVTGLYAKSSKGAVSSPLTSTNKKTGFVRCQSDPVLNKNLQLDGLGYIDRGENPSTPLNTSRLIESLPASPGVLRQGDSEDTEDRQRSISNVSPMVITIGDEDDDESKDPLVKKHTDTESPSQPNKKRKTSNSKSKTGSSATSLPTSTSKKKGVIDAIYSTTTFSQIGGNEKTIEEVQKLLLHMRYPEVYQHIGVTPPQGFLLHGPPGCGKTLMAHAIAGELQLPFFKLAATELVSGVSGESEERVRNMFTKAAASAPCVLFIDEVDSITPKRETASKDMERRIVSQFLTCLDDLCEKKDAHVLVIGATNRPDSLDPALRRAGRFDREISMGIPDVKARESILKVLCKGIRLAEDFDFLSMSNLTPGYVGADLSSLVREAAMCAINRVFVALEQNVTLGQSQKQKSIIVAAEATDRTKENLTHKPLPPIAENDPAMGVNDSISISDVKSAAENVSTGTAPPNRPLLLSAVTPIQQPPPDNKSQEHTGSWWKNLPSIPEEQLKSLHIELNDFTEALKIVQPSAKREGFATVPDVTWSDIGALKAIREELQMAILAPIRYPEQFQSLGLNNPSGVLLAGPPGCGKTLLAKAIANESGINFISVKGPELINMYVGESEKAVRQVFQRARNSSPCVVFFDELDSLCPRRSLGGSDGGSGSRIVNQMLTEMDGLQERKQVFVMGATNRPDIIDPAVLRPGRLDKTLHVGLPTLEDRIDILRTITKQCTKPLIEGVDLAEIAALPQCDGFSGADLTAVIREASMAAMKEYISAEMGSDTPPAAKDVKIVLTRQHFEIALSKTKPSISTKDREHYRKMSVT